MMLDRGRVRVITTVDEGLRVAVTLDVHDAQQPQPQWAGHDLGQRSRGVLPQCSENCLPRVIRLAGKEVFEVGKLLRGLRHLARSRRLADLSPLPPSPPTQ